MITWCAVICHIAPMEHMILLAVEVLVADNVTQRDAHIAMAMRVCGTYMSNVCYILTIPAQRSAAIPTPQHDIPIVLEGFCAKISQRSLPPTQSPLQPLEVRVANYGV